MTTRCRMPAQNLWTFQGVIWGLRVPLKGALSLTAMCVRAQNKWMIKARVSSKGDVRRYNGKKGEGKVFSFDVVDKAHTLPPCR